MRVCKFGHDASATSLYAARTPRSRVSVPMFHAPFGGRCVADRAAYSSRMDNDQDQQSSLGNCRRGDWQTTQAPKGANAEGRKCRRAHVPNDARAEQRGCRTAQAPKGANGAEANGAKRVEASRHGFRSDVIILTIVISRFRIRQYGASLIRFDSKFGRRCRIVSSASPRATRSERLRSPIVPRPNASLMFAEIDWAESRSCAA